MDIANAVGVSDKWGEEMKYIVIVLVIVTIMHDISLWRLNNKFNTLVGWIDMVMHRIKEEVKRGTDDEDN